MAADRPEIGRRAGRMRKKKKEKKGRNERVEARWKKGEETGGKWEGGREDVRGCLSLAAIAISRSRLGVTRSEVLDRLRDPWHGVN